MAHVSIRMPDSEKLELERYARFCGESVSTLIRKLLREKMEDEEDMKAIKKYEKSKKDGTLKTYTHKEVWSEILLDEQI